MVKKVIGSLWMLCVVFQPLTAQTTKEKWVDSVFQTMSQAEKIGQLFMLVAPSGKEAGLTQLENRVKDFALGGIVFETSKPHEHAGLIKRLQSASRVPLLIAQNGNFGILSPDSTISFPSPQIQGAMADDSLIYQYAKEVAGQMKQLGINLHFIPANLATDENVDSYGEDRFRVANKSLAYWKGLQSQGILACAKYFPVQGLSIAAIEKGMPTVTLAVDSLQAYPFKVLFRNQLPALMPAAKDFPLFYSTKKTALRNLISSRALSSSFAGDWIRQHMKYQGLILIDIDNMVRSTDKFASGDAEVFAFQAGNDVLVVSSGINGAIRKMKRLLRRQKEYIPQLDRSVKKILAMKYEAGLSSKPAAATENRLPELSPVETRILQKKMYQSAITVISNRQHALPVRLLEDKKFTCIIADDSVKGKVFTNRFSKYVQAQILTINEKSATIDLTDNLRPRQVVVVAVFPSTKASTLNQLLPVLRSPDSQRDIIFCDFGSPAFKPFAHEFPSVITAYSDVNEMLTGVAEVIFGGLPAEGILPVAFGQIPAGATNRTIALDRLTYSFPEDVGMDTRTLEKIGAIADEAIAMGATPGCHVLIAKAGKVIYEKSFGHLTYEKQEPVTDQTIYDLASVTKVTATLQATMFLHDRGLIDVNKKASRYLPELKQSNKKDFILKDILTHQAGLWPFLPFWAQTMQDTAYMPEYYSHKPSEKYPLVVADRLFAATTMRDSLWNWIVKAKIREKPQRTPFDYRYSDMGFYILQHLAERLLNQPLEDFLSQNLYEPLGASTTGYRPLLRFPINRIAPTENDKLFRRALLIGTVHDQGAAMLGGVAGHAGLFSNANDLAKLGQMLLQEGAYGGTRYYHPETVRLFTQKQFENSRRGLGWDKPTPGDWSGPTSYYASPRTFGHTGFTGTCIWVDPEFQVVYIFLSNRVHPDMTNNKLLSANIRSRIQDVIYQSIFNYCRTAGDVPGVPVSMPVEAIGKAK